MTVQLVLVLTSIALIAAYVYAPMAGEAESNAHYVGTDGDNSNPGTESRPWRTIQYAVNNDNVNPGDTIYVRAGTYYESVQFQRSGQEGSPITLTNYSGEAVTVNGGASPAILDGRGTEYWVIEGFTLDSDAQHAIKLDAWGDGETYGGVHNWVIRDNHIIGAVFIHGSYNLFEGNEVDGSQHKGSEDGVWTLYPISHHNTIRNNHVHHFNSRGIWTMNRTHHDVIEGNYVHHIQGQQYSQGIDTDGYGTVEWGHTIRGNVVHDCDQAGIQLENTFDTIVENNIVYNTGEQGIIVMNYAECVAYGGYGADDCRGLSTENIVRQNLVYHTGSEGGIISHDGGGIRVWGNTIYDGERGVALFDSAPACEVRSNIIWGTRREAIGLFGNTLMASDHNLLSDPHFADPANNDFHLRADSPAIDSGIDIGLAADLDGNPRPIGSGYDIGAYEYGASVRLVAWWRDGTAYLSWTKPLYPDLAGYRIHYASETGSDANEGPSPISVSNPDRLTFQLTGLSMYSLYEVWIEPHDGNGDPLAESNHVPILPTDIHLYLPLVLRG